MSKFNKIINSFTQGEISPRYYGRTDDDKYSQGARELLNKIVRVQGGAARRPGTLFLSDGYYNASMAKVASFSTPVRTIPFEFSRNDAAVVVLSAANSFNSVGISVWIPSTKQWVSPTISLSSGYQAFTGWTTQTQLDAIQFTQSGDVLVMVSAAFPPLFLVRSGTVGSYVYTLKDIYSVRTIFSSINRYAYGGTDLGITPKLSPTAPPGANKPYYNVPYNLITQDTDICSASATTGSIALTRSTLKWNNNHVGTIVGCTKSGITGYVRVNSISGGFQANCTVLKTLGGTGNQDSFQDQEWGCRQSWPTVVCFHDQRIWYANTDEKPNTMWASQIGDFTEMMILRPADDANFSNLSNDRPFSYSLASNSVDDIQWLMPGKTNIFIGTSGAEWIGSSSSDGSVLGPLNPGFTLQTSYGSKTMQALNLNGSILFTDRTGQHIRELTYNRVEDNYHAIAVDHYADHMIKKGIDIYANYAFPEIITFDSQAGSNNVLWIKDSNGILHAVAKDRDFGTIAWSTMQFGGVNDVIGKPPVVKSVCVISNENGKDDDVYVMIQRYINGSTVLYFEKINNEFLGPALNEPSLDIQQQPVYSDSAVMAIGLTTPYFLAKYGSSIDADFGIANPLTGTGTGSPAIAGGGLDLRGGGLKYVSYAAANALLANTGSFYMEVKFDPAWTSVADLYFFSLSKTNADNGNLLTMFWDRTNSFITVSLRDSTGVSVATLQADWAPAAGQTYKFIFAFDSTAGNYVLYINGIKFITTVGLGGTTVSRNTTIANFVVGTNYTKSANSNFIVNKFALALGNPHLGANQNGLYAPAVIVNKTVLGLTHLPGATAEVVGDGRYFGNLNVATTDLAQTAAIALVGLKYISRVIPMDIEAGSILGSAQGEIRRLHEITARFERSVGCKFGRELANLEDINFQGFTYVANTPIPLVTGDFTLKFPPGYERTNIMILQQELPFPCTITGIIARGLAYD